MGAGRQSSALYHSAECQAAQRVLSDAGRGLATFARERSLGSETLLFPFHGLCTRVSFD